MENQNQEDNRSRREEQERGSASIFARGEN